MKNWRTMSDERLAAEISAAKGLLKLTLPAPAARQLRRAVEVMKQEQDARTAWREAISNNRRTA